MRRKARDGASLTSSGVLINKADQCRGFGIADFAEALRGASIRSGDAVLMHSSLMHLGRPRDCSLDAYPQAVVDAVLAYLGDNGTLAVPTPNWDYSSKGVPFDIRSSPVERSMGVVSAHMISRTGVERSVNPIFSIAAIGRHARSICRPDTGSAFGVDSAWDRLFNLDARMLMLGSGIDTLSFVRYIEFRFGVPYLYNKLFSTVVVDSGKQFSVTVTAPLRYRHCSATYDLRPFGERLRSAGVVQEVQLGGGTISMITMSDCYRVGVDALKEDIHFFLKEAPHYVSGEIPIA